MKRCAALLSVFLLFSGFLFAANFNSKMSDSELETLKNGGLLVRNIDFYSNISLDAADKAYTDFLRSKMKKLAPRYLVEVIKYIPYEGMEDLPERFENILNNVQDYVGIPYWSVEAERWFDLFTYAKITDKYNDDEKYVVKADLRMDPFDIVSERFEVRKTENSFLYLAINENKLSYHNVLDCVWPERMQIGIYVFRDDETGCWVMYGIGGVRAPRFPFFHKRISISFINRIKTLCEYFLNKL